MADSEEFWNKWVVNGAITMYVSSIVTVLNVGIQSFMCIYGLSAFLQTPRDLRKGRLPYIAISFLILTLLALTSAFELYRQFTTMYFSGPGEEFRQAENVMYTHWSKVTSQVLMYLYMTIGDGLLLYRCYIIWQNAPWVIVLPGVMYLSFIGLTISTISRDSTGITLRDLTQIGITRKINSALSMFTFLTNVTATSLIAYKLIRAHRDFSKSVPGRNVGVYRTVTRILIESALPLSLFGFLFALFGVLQLVYVTKSPASALPFLTASMVVGIFYTNFAALAPQLIIFRVTTGRSFVRHDETEFSIHPESRLSQPIAFHSIDSVGEELTKAGRVV
ncbi:hypothetical protein CC2G_004313 [Coprinopsis cinerea AmutBmut pab1-1]|nr:hypothetical protein CC2G_004313 [Coprinopsis cinerea AmutBmut pab1-1]